MRLNKKIAAVVLSSTLAVACIAGCTGGGDDAGNGERITFWGITDQYTSSSYSALVDAYNEGQGKIDGVFVKYSPKTDSSANHMAYCTSARGTVDIIGVSDRYVFNNIAQGFYTNLQDFIDDSSTYTTNADGEAYFSEDNYASGNIDRFRFNTETYEAGEGEDLYALPLVANATVIYYNEDYFVNNNINIISVTEEELDAYNSANGTSYAPRGYAEYTVDAMPADGLKTSENLDGEEVVKVFNNLIPMSFLEVNTLSKYFTQEYNSDSPSKYGVLNEWWFSHGWSVGGDCVKWDEDMGQYKFTLGDKEANYLVTSAVTINGTSYEAGDILSYADRNYVLENSSSDITSHLYELPSQYEQFREFCAWSQETDKKVDDDVYGYGISPSPATLNNSSKVQYFTSGEVAMLIDGTTELDPIYNALVGKTEWDIAPVYTYREFEGEDPSGDGTLKIIGKEYDGVEFTGELKEVDGTQIVGKLSGSSQNFGWAIPANSEHKEAAWKFLQYLTSADGQSFFVANDAGAPSISSYINSAEYYDKENKKCDNYRAISIMAECCTIGDWSYFEDGEWISDWSLELNTDVRNGVTTLVEFFDHQQVPTDALLAEYKFKLHGKE